MKRWIQRLLAGALCLALAGCGGPRLEEYPRVEPEKKETAPQALTIDLPRDSDQLTVDAVNQLSAAVLELSGGAVTLSPIFSDRPAIALREGSTHMALLTNRDILEAEPALSFIDWPFFWDSPEQYLTVMGAEEGLVRGSGDLAAALGGQVAGVWYGGRVALLCRAAFYEEVAFAGSAFGGLAGRGGTGYFTDIGEDLQARETLEREPEELLPLLDQREVKYLEYPLLSMDAEGLPQSLKYLEDTAHRVQGHWLAISDQVEPETAALLFIRPVSGSGALAVGSELMAAHGPDSYIGRVAAVMLGSTETTFYTIAVYFGSAGIRKTRYAIPAALIADLAGFMAAAMAVRLLFGTA